ncbi:hypothetical protein BDF20DRAFT_837265 [Mycotypha africana]|uniref:uncharacterized protein n=1 Tax=Mycotypha africana TaxID=64632 RepID=UPI002300A730|nr:uncharacterized protein BDF20DRAFT_837265 [Mycotypha africana]KAI8973312.1 hypothetical protein BDF20DRAFT_837265 [Mycotypha africana]
MNQAFVYNSSNNVTPYSGNSAYETMPSYVYHHTSQPSLQRSSQMRAATTNEAASTANATGNSTATPTTLNYHPSYYHQNEMIAKGSPSSISSIGYSSPKTPPTITFSQHNAIHSATHIMPHCQNHMLVKNTFDQKPSLMVSPLPSFEPQQQQQSTEERVKKTIARANTVPAEFYQTQFLQYQVDHKSSHLGFKRKRTTNDEGDCKANSKRVGELKANHTNDKDISTIELRRQVHIQSEQKRRAQIKDGFEELKNHLPGCANKKLSKAALLTRTVQQLEHMRKMQSELLFEVERLMEENSNLKRYATAIQQH